MPGLVTCPRCGVQFTHARVAPGEETVCPNCSLAMVIDAAPDGRLVPAPADADDPFFGTASRPPGPGDPGAGPGAPPDRFGGGGRRPRRFQFEVRRLEPPRGCCLLGCAAVILFFALAVRGCLSLFS